MSGPDIGNFIRNAGGDPTDDPRALYRRAASTMIRPRPRRSK